MNASAMRRKNSNAVTGREFWEGETEPNALEAVTLELVF